MKASLASYSGFQSSINSCSFETHKHCKSPIGMKFPKPTIMNKFQNLESLQKIKDQILNLQNTLNNQQLSKAKLKNQDKSFLNIIKDQLKQVNQVTEIKNSERKKKPSFSKQSSSKENSMRNPNHNMLKTLLQLQHQDFKQIKDQEKEAMQQRIINLNDKKKKLLRKLKKRYKEEKEKIILYIDEQVKKEEQDFEQKIKLRIQDTLIQKKKQEDLQKPENKWPNTLRLSRSQSGRVYNQIDKIDTSSSESLKNLLKQKNGQCEKDSENDELKLQLVSSLKKLSPYPERSQQNYYSLLFKVSFKNKKKKQKVRFKNQNQIDEKNNMTQPLTRYKTDEDEDDSFSDYDPKFNSLNRYY